MFELDRHGVSLSRWFVRREACASTRKAAEMPIGSAIDSGSLSAFARVFLEWRARRRYLDPRMHSVRPEGTGHLECEQAGAERD
jgi:hypothetical protein